MVLFMLPKIHRMRQQAKERIKRAIMSHPDFNMEAYEKGHYFGYKKKISKNQQESKDTRLQKSNEKRKKTTFKTILTKRMKFCRKDMNNKKMKRLKRTVNNNNSGEVQKQNKDSCCKVNDVSENNRFNELMKTYQTISYKSDENNCLHSIDCYERTSTSQCYFVAFKKCNSFEV